MGAFLCFKMADFIYKHQGKSKFWMVWQTMKQRCNSPYSHSYKSYGARGITVDNRWLSFRGFYEDMFSSYKEGLTLERINNHEGYSKENCKWATRKEQALNTRNVERAARYTYKGMTKTIREWAQLIGLKRSTLGERLQRYGWSTEKAIGGHIG